MLGPADLDRIKSEARLGAIPAELRFREGVRQPRGAHVQNTTEFSRAAQTKAIKAGLATHFPIHGHLQLLTGSSQELARNKTSIGH